MYASFLFTLSSCIYSSKTQHRLFNAIENKQFDAIIVPGIPFQNGQWDRIMRGRVYWSKYLYDKGIAKNIIYSGSAVYSPYYEGKIMALYAEAIGIPKEHIFIETKAEHTTENIYYSYHLGKKLGFKTFAFASDPFQTKMLRKYIHKKIDPAVPVIPFVVDTLKILEPGMVNPTIDYQEAFKPDFISIKKRESFWKRWRGTRGKNIVKNAYD
ncbi:MAG: YdcF family protein [Chitinophagaceae bacterium]